MPLPHLRSWTTLSAPRPSVPAPEHRWNRHALPPKTSLSRLRAGGAHQQAEERGQHCQPSTHSSHRKPLRFSMAPADDQALWPNPPRIHELSSEVLTARVRTSKPASPAARRINTAMAQAAIAPELARFSHDVFTHGQQHSFP